MEGKMAKRKFAGVLMAESQLTATPVVQLLPDDIVGQTQPDQLLSPQKSCENSQDLPSIPASQEILNTTTPAKSTVDAASGQIVTPISVVKERKRRIIVDDDDESPTWQRGFKRTRGRGRGSRGRGGLNRNSQHRLQMLSSPEKSRDASIFTTPEVSLFECFIVYI